MYSPVLARFISPDSIVPRPEDPQSFNRYAYVRNSPLVRVDPSGHADCPVLSSPACKPSPDVLGSKPKPTLKSTPKSSNPFFSNQPSLRVRDTSSASAVGTANSSIVNAHSSKKEQPTSKAQSTAGMAGSMSSSGFNYISVNLVTPLGSFGGTRDQAGNLYITAGPGLGLGFALNVFGGTIDRSFGAPGGFVHGLTGKAYDPAVTSQEFLTGVSLNVGAGVILGGQLVWSPATSFGGEVGASLGGYAGLGVQIPLLMFDGQGVVIPLPSCDRSGCFSVIP